MSLTDELYEFELSLINACTTKYEYEISLLADDFIEFGSSGNIYNKSQTLEMLRRKRKHQTDIVDFKLKAITNTIVLVTYRSRHHGTPVIETLRSSIWRKSDNSWELLFHQGTPVANSE